MFRILIAITTIFVSLNAVAQRKGGDGHSGVQRKQEARVRTRWSLADWLDQKKRNSLMDQWLYIHTSDEPFEFWIQAERSVQDHLSSTTPDTTEKYQFWKGRGGAYATIIGVEGGYDFPWNGWTAWDASLNLRILGSAYQNTNLTLKGGAKSYGHEDPDTKEQENWQLPFGGAQLTLYINRYFGLQGEYWRLGSEKSNKNRRLRGDIGRALLFIDFSFVRVYGGVSREALVFEEQDPSEYTESRDAAFGGVALFF